MELNLTEVQSALIKDLEKYTISKQEDTIQSYADIEDWIKKTVNKWYELGLDTSEIIERLNSIGRIDAHE